LIAAGMALAHRHGEVLAGYARQVFELVAQAENALTDVGRLASGRVSIGASPGVGVYLAPHWVQQFRSQYPRLTVAFNTGVTAQITADVLAHRIDLGVIERELDQGRSPRRPSHFGSRSSRAWSSVSSDPFGIFQCGRSPPEVAVFHRSRNRTANPYRLEQTLKAACV